MVKSICGVIITTNNMQGMVDFYKNLVGLPLEKEEHGDLDVHYGADIGDCHFGIHPPSSFQQTNPGNATTKIAFHVESLNKYLETFKRAGLEPVLGPKDEGFGQLACFYDPDGNLIELVELNYTFR